MQYEWIPSPNFDKGRTQPIKYIVIHWWDDPKKKPSIEGVINHLKDPKVKVAAHYVVSGDRVVKMVQEVDRAWHAIAANSYTIGIEVDPQVPGNTYKTVGALVRDIRSRYGNLPLKRHSDFNETDCPGNLDLARIDKEAQEENDVEKDKTILALTRQRDEVAGKLIKAEKVIDAVTKQRDDVAQKLIDTEKALELAQEGQRLIELIRKVN